MSVKLEARKKAPRGHTSVERAFGIMGNHGCRTQDVGHCLLWPRKTTSEKLNLEAGQLSSVPYPAAILKQYARHAILFPTPQMSLWELITPVPFIRSTIPRGELDHLVAEEAHWRLLLLEPIPGTAWMRFREQEKLLHPDCIIPTATEMALALLLSRYKAIPTGFGGTSVRTRDVSADGRQVITLSSQKESSITTAESLCPTVRDNKALLSAAIAPTA